MSHILEHSAAFSQLGLLSYYVTMYSTIHSHTPQCRVSQTMGMLV